MGELSALVTLILEPATHVSMINLLDRATPHARVHLLIKLNVNNIFNPNIFFCYFNKNINYRNMFTRKKTEEEKIIFAEIHKSRKIPFKHPFLIRS